MKNLYPKFFRLFLTITCLTFITGYSTAQISQLRNAGTAASVTGAPCGTTAWVNTTNAIGAINNGTLAISTPAVGSNSACLELTNAGFSIPAGSNITGIRVDINRTTSRTNTSDANVQLIKGGNKIGTNKAFFTNWPLLSTTVTYGGATDLWGTTWTVADINAANFGFSFAALRTSGTAAPNISVDGIEITVYYSGIISGTVFRDYNANGVINNTGGMNEKGVANITVKATLPNETSVTTTTDATGFYNFTTAQIPLSTNVRLEFLNLNNTDFSSTTGSDNNSSVQFVNTASNVIANYGINAPDDYWNNIAQSNPKLLAISYAHGDINHTNSAITSYGILQIDNNTTGHTPTIVNVATQAQVGSLWGMAYQKNQDRYFFANFLKRHVGFGPKGVGGVYMANLSGANYALSGGFTLQGVTPSNSATALDMGTVNRVSTPNTSDFYLATGSDAEGKDLDAFGKAGKVGFGDIEMDDKNQQLIMVNLNQRRLVTINVSGNTTLLNNATAATLAPLTRAYDILALPGVPSCINGQLRPFALKIYKGRGYLGAVCDASATPRDSTNLSGYILSFDPANIAAGFTTEITLNLNYRTSSSNGNTNSWHSWADVWSDVKSGGLYRYPEPLISDIEFDENGGINISIADRFCHQMGVGQTEPVAGSATVIGESRESGDILHACRVGSSWIMEGSAGSCTPANTVDNADGYGDGQTVAAREWYDDQSGDSNLGEFTQGAMAKLMGSNLLVQTMQDPTPAPNTTGEPYYYSAGMHWFDVNTGGWSNWTTLYDGSDAGSPGGGFMKGNGLGDIEFATSPQPIQIGNRIWNDLNGNGIQDANEITSPVAAGTIVTLRSPGVDGIYGNGDDQTWTTTTDAAGNYYFSALATADNRKPATWTGVGSTILPGYDYRIEFGIPTGFQLTKTDASTNSVDNIDNDAILNGTNAFVTFNTGNTNHNFDIGVKPLATLGNKVWLDEGAGGGTRSNGVQDGTEPGVAGVAVNLYQNGADGLPNTADDVLVSSTITDAFGIYSFDNLQPTDQTTAATIAATSYFIRITPPANYATTVQTNGTDDNNTIGASTTGNDVDLLGQSYSINLSAGENNPNIDAGLIFKPQVLTNSIGDKVWFDVNGDGINANNAGEPGVAGVTVTLYDDLTGNIVAITTTDANGNYIFNNLPANANYKVGFSAPAGTVLTTGGVLDLNNSSTNSDPSTTTGLTSTINTSSAGTKITGVDAGLKNDPKGALGDFVWNDTNNNGIQDAGEPGIPGITMQLYGPGADNLPGGVGANADVLLATVTTDANGYYVFPNLDPAKYFVVATAVAGYSLSAKDVVNPAGNTKDNDFGAGAAPYAGKYVSSVFTLLPTAGGVTRDMTVDLGIHNNTAGLASIGDKVWNDVNKDGLQTAGEPGVANVTVRLLDGTGNPVNNPATGKPYVVTTDANGNYKFVDLPAGIYIVEFANLPLGFVFTNQDASGSGAPGSGTDGTNDSDVKVSTGRTSTITVGAGQNITSVDAGITQGIPAGTASLGNRVWYDNGRDATGAIVPANANNGKQDLGELGVNNIKVELLDGSGNPVFVPSTAVPYIVYTNALGEYLFTGLPAGDYKVRFSALPAGFTYSVADQGIDDTIDSDGTATGTTTSTTSTTGTYTLQTGEDNLTVDLGIVPAAGTNTIGNFVWNDLDANGKQDASEPGVQGVTVILYTNGADGIAGTADDVRVGVTTTDNNGAYSFIGLADGNYNVGFTNLPAGFSFTDKDKAGSTAADGSDANTASGRTGTIALDPTSASATGVNDITVDAGLISTRAALGNQVWLDIDGDGLLNNGEKGVSGVTVTLYDDATSAVLASTITDADGKYYFGNLLPGDYKVGFSTIPINLSFTKQTTPGVADNNTNNNSDADPATGLTTKITLIAGETDLTIDAGLKPDNFASVGDYVWNDLDGLGTQSATEPGVPGILVTLYDATTNLPVGTAITDGNGKYLISKIPVATGGTSFYIIFSNLPAGAQFTGQTDNVTPGDATLGSDANTATGKTSNFTLTQGQYLPTVDAGIKNVQVVPVKITSFTAVPKGSQVNLEWMVSEQTNVASYEVETSVDGRTFTSIAAVSSNGNQGATYNAIHANPVAGINYYRIKTTDKNGAISYSEIRKVNFGKGGDVVIYPNPVSEGVVNITLTGNMINKSATVSILSMEGKLVNQLKIVKTSQTETIDISILASGSYIVRLVTENEVVNKTIQVIR
jgi:SdrD B-like domain/Secretion system C-terminal sorting domain